MWTGVFRQSRYLPSKSMNRALSQLALGVLLCSVLAATFSPPHWAQRLSSPWAGLLRPPGDADVPVKAPTHEAIHSQLQVHGRGPFDLFGRREVRSCAGATTTLPQEGSVRRVSALHGLVNTTKRILSAFWRLLTAIVPKGDRRLPFLCPQEELPINEAVSNPPLAKHVVTLPKGGASVIAHAPSKPVPPAYAAQHELGTEAMVVDLGRFTPQQKQAVNAGHRALLAQHPGLAARAQAVGLVLDEHTVARYLIAFKWNLDSVHLIEKTVRWREEQGIAELGPEHVGKQATSGCLQIDGTDKAGRPLIYFRPALQDFSRPDQAVQYLVYTLERALRMAGQRQRDAYSLVIDLRGLGYHNTPPLHAIQKVTYLLHFLYPIRVGLISFVLLIIYMLPYARVFHLLRFHYPMRVGFISIVHAGTPFMLLWKALKGLVCPYTREKISIVGGKDQTRHLLERIRPEQLQVAYGGQNDARFDVHHYLSAHE